MSTSLMRFIPPTEGDQPTEDVVIRYREPAAWREVTAKLPALDGVLKDLIGRGYEVEVNLPASDWLKRGEG